MRGRSIHRILYCLLLVGLVSCQESPHFQGLYSPDKQVWMYDDLATFDFNISDTASRYDMYLDVRHTHGYPFQNLYVNIISSFPDGASVKEQHSLELQEKNGEWLGDCGSKDCELRFILREGMRFDALGDYQISFEQFTRRDSLEGIVSLGLVLNYHTEKE